jgi:ABC-type molybdenum transport system ATPase subunit/photorepair protein PhrA
VKFEDGRSGTVSATLKILDAKPSAREGGRMNQPAMAPEPTATRAIGDVILDVKNISLRFGGVKALTDISFNVREHEIRAIIGPNGAGKSSMLNCINGVYTPAKARSPSAARPSAT